MEIDISHANLFTWEGLLSVGQMSLLLYMMVQLTKSIIDRYLPGFPTDFYSFILGFITVMVVQFGNGASPLDWKVWALGFFNTFIIVANSGFIAQKSQNPPQFNFRKKDKKEKNKTSE